MIRLRKSILIKFPQYTENAIWGAVAGAVAITLFGFVWGGWKTQGKADEYANQKVSAALQIALAPVCADMFKRDTKFKENLAELKKADEWARGTLIEKGGWGKLPGANDLDSETTKACAQLLIKG